LTGSLLLSILTSTLSIWVPLMIDQGSIAINQRTLFYAFMGIGSMLISTCLWVLVAIFGWRKKQEPAKSSTPPARNDT
jgi:ABC-type enterochelin transport system permease subunit